MGIYERAWRIVKTRIKTEKTNWGRNELLIVMGEAMEEAAAEGEGCSAVDDRWCGDDEEPPAGKSLPKRQCPVPFDSGKPCTWVPIPGYPCCVNHALRFVQLESGLSVSEVAAIVLGPPDPGLP